MSEYGNLSNLSAMPVERTAITLDVKAFAHVVVDMIDRPYSVPSQIRAGVLATWDTLTGVDVENSKTMEEAQACLDQLAAYARAVLDGTADITIKED